MALWAKTQQLPSEIFQQVSALYAADLFPIEVRHYLAQWLEEQNWNDIDEENVAFSQDAQAFVEQLIGKLNEVGSNLDFVQQIQFQKYADGFRRFLSSPLDLVRVVKHCLNTEIRFIQQAETGNVVASVERNSHLWIAQKLDEVKRKAQQTTLDLRNLEQAQETFWLKFNEFNRMNAIFSAQMAQATTDAMKQDVQKKLGVQKDKLGNTINGIIAELVGGRMRLAECYKEIVMNLTAVQSQVLDVDLIQWKREQQLAGNGAMFNNNLEVIQQWCEGLADSIWNTRQQIKELERLINKASLPGGEEGAKLVSELRAQITQLLSSLVTSTFVIEKQPPQVMKTNTRFTAVVRLLVGGKLNVHMTSPQVKVNILSDAQANALLRSDQAAKYESSGEILNNTGAMEYIAATRQLVVNFRNMQLRKIRRAEKKGTESVMDEKFSLLFLSEFSIGSGELEFQNIKVWTLSLPVVVIVHGNQEPHAWATVSWDNAFAESGRPCFQVPERVPWPQVADMLNTKFMSSCERPLTEDNIKFLAGKAFRNHNVADYSQLMLNWTAFAKEPLPDRNFTFWEWYYGILKLTREHLKNLWKDGLIMGFVGKVQAQDMLMKQSMGNFLLRFSDSELGGISIAAFKAETAGGGPGVDHLQPWTSKDFGIRSLADRIHDLGNLLFLYPDLPKDRAFQKYYTPPAEAQPTSTGYVKPELVTRVPGWSEGGLSEAGSYPSTPYNNYPQSPPDLTRDTPSSFSEPAGFPLEALEGFEWLDEASIPQDFNMDFNSLNLGQLQPNAVLDPSQFSFTTDQIQFP